MKRLLELSATKRTGGTHDIGRLGGLNNQGLLTPSYNKGSIPLPDSSYFMPGIYDTTRTYAATSPRYYTIVGRAQDYR